MCFVEIVTTSQSINELNYFPNCDTLQARQPFGNYSVLLYLYFTVIIFLIRLLCVTYRFRTTLTKNKQQFETHGFGCVSQQNSMWAALSSEWKLILKLPFTDHANFGDFILFFTGQLSNLQRFSRYLLISYYFANCYDILFCLVLVAIGVVVRVKVPGTYPVI